MPSNVFLVFFVPWWFIFCRIEANSEMKAAACRCRILALADRLLPRPEIHGYQTQHAVQYSLARQRSRRVGEAVQSYCPVKTVVTTPSPKSPWPRNVKVFASVAPASGLNTF